MSLIKRLPFGFRQRCEAISTDIRFAMHLRPFDRLPAEVLANHLGATLLAPEDIPGVSATQVAVLLASNQWSAAIISRCPLRIMLNPNHSSDRHESNLMHEYAHVLLEHDMVAFDLETGLPHRREKDEDEATYLGSCLQIPQRGLLWAKQTGLTLPQTSNHFGASEAMVRFRCNVIGVKLPTQDKAHP